MFFQHTGQCFDLASLGALGSAGLPSARSPPAGAFPAPFLGGFFGAFSGFLVGSSVGSRVGALIVRLRFVGGSSVGSRVGALAGRLDFVGGSSVGSRVGALAGRLGFLAGSSVGSRVVALVGLLGLVVGSLAGFLGFTVGSSGARGLLVGGGFLPVGGADRLSTLPGSDFPFPVGRLGGWLPVGVFEGLRRSCVIVSQNHD